MSPTALWPSPKRRGAVPALPCAEAREAVSASLDSETSPWPESAVARHLGQCPLCRSFLREVQVLPRPPRLHGPKPVPAHLTQSLLPLVARVGGARPIGRTWGRHRPSHYPIFGPRLSVRWLATLLPALAVVGAVSSGAVSSPKLVPARPPSPCTIGLSEPPQPAHEP